MNECSIVTIGTYRFYVIQNGQSRGCYFTICIPPKMDVLRNNAFNNGIVRNDPEKMEGGGQVRDRPPGRLPGCTAHSHT